MNIESKDGKSAQLTSPYWKFKAFDTNTFKSLINEEFWFSHPEHFNDPFDTPSGKDIEEFLEVLQKKLGLKNYQEIASRLPKIMELYDDWLKYRFVFCVNSYDGKVEPFREVLMWSHYAAEHKGLCLGLSLSNWVQHESEPSRQHFDYYRYQSWPIYYDDETISNYMKFLDYDSSTLPVGMIEQLVEKVAFKKAKSWSYENEHRFIHWDKKLVGKPGIPIKFDGKNLENIVFGLKANETDMNAVIEIVKSKGWSHVKFWKAKKGEHMLDLEFDEIQASKFDV